MAEARSPFASAGVDGTATENPGMCMNSASSDCECCAAVPLPTPCCVLMVSVAHAVGGWGGRRGAAGGGAGGRAGMVAAADVARGESVAQHPLPRARDRVPLPPAVDLPGGPVRLSVARHVPAEAVCQRLDQGR